MSRLRYTEDHEWLRLEADGTVAIGISAYALERLGEIIFVELPAIGERIERDGEAVVLESAKCVVEVRMPFTGVIVAVNEALTADLAALNSDPMEAGWLFKARRESAAERPALLDETAYLRLIAGDGRRGEP